VPTSTNSFAIASLACSILLSWLFGVGGVLGLVFGIIGLKQCSRLGQRGRGLAVAGIIIGGLVVGFWLLVLIVIVASGGGSDSSGSLGASGALAALF
jgi:hypothetical protein